MIQCILTETLDLLYMTYKSNVQRKSQVLLSWVSKKQVKSSSVRVKHLGSGSSLKNKRSAPEMTNIIHHHLWNTTGTSNSNKMVNDCIYISKVLYNFTRYYIVAKGVTKLLYFILHYINGEVFLDTDELSSSLTLMSSKILSVTQLNPVETKGCFPIVFVALTGYTFSTVFVFTVYFLPT